MLAFFLLTLGVACGAPAGKCCDTKDACGSATSVCKDASTFCAASQANCEGKCAMTWCPDAPTPPPAPSPAIPTTIDSTRVLHVVSPSFLSFTVDACNVRAQPPFAGRGFNVSEPSFRALAAAMAPAYLRFGGTSADNLTYDMGDDNGKPRPGGIPAGTLLAADWDALADFAAASNWSLVVGLNALAGAGPAGTEPWDPANARTLLAHVKAKGQDVVGWELGNEPGLSNKGLPHPRDPAQLARDIGALRTELVREFGSVGGGTRASPWLLGPDTTKGKLDYASQVLRALSAAPGTAPVLDAVTWHHYYLAGAGSATQPADFSSAKYLNTFAQYAQGYVALWRNASANASAVQRPSLWLGETGGAGGATATAKQVTGTVRGLFWYADKLGTAAASGHSVVCRQEWSELVKTNGPKAGGGLAFVAPDFWLALLWKRLVGSQVLQVLPAAAQTGNLRVYAHRATAAATQQLLQQQRQQRHAPRRAPAALIVINLSNETSPLQLSIDGAAANASAADVYSLSAPSGADVTARTVALNGQELSVAAGGALPALAPLHRPAGTPLTVAPASVTFFVL